MSTDRAPLNLLIAYPYMTAGAFALLDELRQVGPVRWLLDSGAFTAWKAGTPIRLDDYCRFVEGLKHQPWRYFNLDVIGDGPASLANYERMRSRGFAPVPVFTRGEALSVLDRYYETSDVVGIGGLVSRVSDPRGYVKHLEPHLRGRKYHLLGFSQLDWLKYLRPYSVDSSSWESAARYGQLAVYMGRGRIESIDFKTYQKRLGRDEALAARVRALGYDPTSLRHDAAWRGGQGIARQVTTVSWMAFSIDAERNLGTHVFLARSHPSTFLPGCYARALRATGHAVDRIPEYQPRRAS